jgi:hypothetical protein
MVVPLDHSGARLSTIGRSPQNPRHGLCGGTRRLSNDARPNQPPEPLCGGASALQWTGWRPPDSVRQHRDRQLTGPAGYVRLRPASVLGGDLWGEKR